jgi:flagella basal body P-ring formation protein FlgA
VVSLRTTQALAAHQIVDRTAIAWPAPVARGTLVTAIIRHGAVTVSAPATLEQRSRLGQRAIARLGTRIIKGRLSAPDQIEVELGFLAPASVREFGPSPKGSGLENLP